MRSQDDIQTVRFTSKGSVTLDLERVEQDPAYLRIAGRYDMTDSKQRDQVLCLYVAFHFGSERMFTNLPTAMGPGDVFPEKMEVVHGVNGYCTAGEPVVASAAD